MCFLFLTLLAADHEPVIHWPVAFAPGKGLLPRDEEGNVILDLETSLVDTWKTMIGFQKAGKESHLILPLLGSFKFIQVKNIGVSNFSVEHIKAITEATGVKPTVNQVELHPLNPQDELLEFCKNEGIHVTAYSPLGNNSKFFLLNPSSSSDSDVCLIVKDKPKLTDHPSIKEIAHRLGATEAQVLIAWAAQRGTSVIPKSVNEGERFNTSSENLTDAEASFRAHQIQLPSDHSVTRRHASRIIRG